MSGQEDVSFLGTFFVCTLSTCTNDTNYIIDLNWKLK
jgi:hypothetical protein